MIKNTLKVLLASFAVIAALQTFSCVGQIVGDGDGGVGGDVSDIRNHNLDPQTDVTPF